MGTFSVKNQTSKTSFEYKNSKMIVAGNFEKCVSKGTLTSYTGQCYRLNDKGQQDEFIGNFNGFSRNGGQGIKYSLSEMNRKDSTDVWDTIEEIEPHVLGEEQAGETAE